MARGCSSGVRSCVHAVSCGRQTQRQHRRPRRQAAVPPRASSSSTARFAGDAAQSGAQQIASEYKPQDARLKGFPAPLDKEIFKMALPSFATIIMDPLLGMTDTMIMGRIGGNVLAGVGLGSIVCGGFNWIFGFLSVLTVPRVAQAIAADDKARATEHIGQALWVAVVVGVTTMCLVLAFGPQMLQSLGGDPGVTAQAVEYSKYRCLGNPFVLVNFVMMGTLRGIKDAQWPLIAAAFANVFHLALVFWLVYGLHMEAGAAAFATSLSQGLSAVMLFGVLVKRGYVTWQDFKVGPKWRVLRPFLVDGVAVSVRTVTVIGVIMASTGVLARINAASQAAHEIIRQLWIFLFQFVECINISNQAIVSTALGAEDTRYAYAVVKRHLTYAVGIVSLVAVAVYSQQGWLLGRFTRDAAIVATAGTTIPLVAAAFPLDATSSILDGTLTAAGQAKWTAANTTVTSALTLVALLGAERVMSLSLLRVWMFLKMMTLLRLPLLLRRTFVSEHSPFSRAAVAAGALAPVDEQGLDKAKAVPHIEQDPTQELCSGAAEQAGQSRR